jgi:glycosyltransferase involved in cell wall biosynthesis
MWAKNGEQFLPTVLKRIDAVISHESIHKKIFVDDHSADNTVQIARGFNWTVYDNSTMGISSAANEALRHVDCDQFISVEQDLLLAHDWFDKISPYLEKEDVAIAQGIRLATEPTLRALDTYFYLRRSPPSKVMDLDQDHSWITSMDNDILRTSVIRKVGGYPSLPRGFYIDEAGLLDKIREVGFRWIVDKTAISDHIRPSIEQFYSHSHELWGKHDTNVSTRSNMRMFLTSPLWALRIAMEEKCPKMLTVYPRLRYIPLRARKAKDP